MAHSMRVIGFIPPDADWQKMADVWHACKAAKIDPPPEVEAFFDDGAPDPHGQEVSIPHHYWELKDCLSEGVEVIIAELPKKVKVVRFVNSW